jgi:hypothetical protein
VKIDGDFVEFSADFKGWDTISRRVPADRRFDTF